MMALKIGGAVGVQGEPELVDRHSEDTLDKKEQPEPKEMIVIAKLLDPTEINTKRETPGLNNS